MAIKTHLKDDKVIFTVTVNNIKLGCFDTLDEAKQCELTHKNGAKQIDVSHIIARLDKQDAVISELQASITRLESLVQIQSTESSDTRTTKSNPVVQKQSTQHTSASASRLNTVNKTQSTGYNSKSVVDESEEW